MVFGAHSISDVRLQRLFLLRLSNRVAESVRFIRKLKERPHRSAETLEKDKSRMALFYKYPKEKCYVQFLYTPTHSSMSVPDALSPAAMSSAAERERLGSNGGGGTPVVLEFTGGAELLVNKQKTHDVILPKRKMGESAEWTISALLPWVVDNLLTVDNAELLIAEGTVRPGLLVLVNDTDWELLGKDKYVIKKDDRITFISTLHGG